MNEIRKFLNREGVRIHGTEQKFKMRTPRETTGNGSKLD